MSPSREFRLGGAIIFAAVFLIGTLLVGGNLSYALLIALCGGLAWLAMGYVMRKRPPTKPVRGQRDATHDAED